MRVIKPIAINDSTLFYSSVPEPDPSVGEVEWESRSWLYDVVHSVYRSDIDEDSGLIYCSENLGNEVYIYNKQWKYSGISFSTALQTDGIDGIAVGNNHVYVLSGNNYYVYKYTLAGVYTGESFQAPNSNGRFPRCLGSDGNRLIVAYEKEALQAPDDLMFVEFSGGSSYPFGAELGINVQISGITKSQKGLLLFDSDTATGSKRFLDFDIKFQNEPDIESVNVGLIGANDLLRVGDVLYSGNGSTKVQQINDIGKPVDGVPLGVEYVLSDTNKRYKSNYINTDNPSQGALKDIPTWTYVSPINKYAAFDERISTVTTEDAELEYEFKPSQVIDSIVGINIKGATTITVTMTDPTFGEVYNKSVTMTDNSEIIDWYNYLWSDFEVITSFALLDLPAYANATTKINIQGASIAAGAIILGKSVTLGEANYGSSIQLIDNSRIEFDEFGEDTIIRRPSAKLVNYDVAVDKARLNYVYRQLENLSGVATVWIGTDEVQDETLVYGYYIDNNIGIDTPTLCKVTIQVRGLI